MFLRVSTWDWCHCSIYENLSLIQPRSLFLGGNDTDISQKITRHVKNDTFNINNEKLFIGTTEIQPYLYLMTSFLQVPTGMLAIFFSNELQNLGDGRAGHHDPNHEHPHMFSDSS